ncbi:MAG: hypothetical protein HYX74_02620 [Acidobacteria bacterium]|nr:hypothetical protein [Acidobacteriota bacterium]
MVVEPVGRGALHELPAVVVIRLIPNGLFRRSQQRQQQAEKPSSPPSEGSTFS